MKLYHLIIKAWSKISISTLQRARNVQIIVEVLVFDHTRAIKRLKKSAQLKYTIPELCGLTLTQTFLSASMYSLTTVKPTTNPIYSITQRRILCEYNRYRLYESTNLRRGVIIGKALFCHVCKIFNHAVKYTYHIERVLRSHPRLRLAPFILTYIPGNNTAITITRYLLTTLRQSAQDTTLLLDALLSQYVHLIPTGKLISDPTNYPQSRITHALHHLTRALNIPSC